MSFHEKETQHPHPIQLPPFASSLSIADYASFQHHLATSSRIVALIGAGLSASSGIPTFRGAGASWRGYSPSQDLANPYCLQRDPVLFWQFFDSRRHLALKSMPNRGHYSLARLAQLKPDFLAITQNIDGLSERAGHNPESLAPFHGSLFESECSNESCDFAEFDGCSDHIIKDFNIPPHIDTADPSVPLPSTSISQLPHCRQCGSLMRPGVVLFFEKLYQNTLDKINRWFDEGDVDLMIVVGTSLAVHPAADFVNRALDGGARVAVVNLEPPERTEDDLRFGEDHWYFQGDAAEVLPEILKGVIGW